jgi:hypothetical protein
MSQPRGTPASEETPAGEERPASKERAPGEERPASKETPAGEQRGGRENAVLLRLADGPLAGPVLCRVVSMVLARADSPVDRLDDAMLICETLCAHAPAYTRDGQLAFALSAVPEGFELRVGELRERGASGLVADAEVPGVGNVLKRTSDRLHIERSAAGHEELVLTLVF